MRRAGPDTCCGSEPCERRVPGDRRETARAGPSPGQLTELAGAVPLTRSGGFPRRRAVRRAACGPAPPYEPVVDYSSVRVYIVFECGHRCAGEDSGCGARSRVEKRRFRHDDGLHRGDWGDREAGVTNNNRPCQCAGVLPVYPDRRGRKPSAPFYFLTRVTRARMRRGLSPRPRCWGRPWLIVRHGDEQPAAPSPVGAARRRTRKTGKHQRRAESRPGHGLFLLLAGAHPRSITPSRRCARRI